MEIEGKGELTLRRVQDWGFKLMLLAPLLTWKSVLHRLLPGPVMGLSTVGP